MTADFDMSQYLGIFLDEVEEQLQILDESIIILEQDKDNMDILNTIFRAAHTLKGSSASMGFNNMAKLTHSLENVLDRLRHRDLVVSTGIVNLLLEGLDSLQVLKNEILNNNEENVQVDDLIARLKKAGEGEVVEMPESTGNPKALAEESGANASLDPKINLDDIERNLVNSAFIRGFNVFHVVIDLVSDCLMKGPRAYIVFNHLKEVGEVIKTMPTVQEIEEEKFESSFELVIVTKEEKMTVANIIKSISEINGVTVNPISLENEGELEELKVDIDAKRETAAAKAMILESKNEEKSNGKLQAPEKNQSNQNNGAVNKVSQTVRVDVQRLENLMNLVGELVIDRTRLLDVGGSLKEKMDSEEMIDTLEEVSIHIGRITTDLQEEIMKARMFPIEQVFNRFPRMVRDLAQKANKKVDFIVDGKETELDRTVIEEIGDPLIHLLRNSIDHGIETAEERERLGKPETGTVKLNAFHQENQIIITVEDDGKGINAEVIRNKAIEKGLLSEENALRLSEREAVNLIFLPGFSTAQVISDVSGRGVGMDIVRAHIEKINGIIDIETELGKGTRFTIKLPLTLAINKSLLVYLENNVFAFPLSSVVEIVNVDKSSIKKIQQRDTILLRGEVLPLVKLREVLDYEGIQELPEKFSVVVCAASEKRVGFIVDDLLGEQEIVIKSLGEYIGQIPGIAGATIMGDGRVALILDVRGLISHAGASTYAYTG